MQQRTRPVLAILALCATISSPALADDIALKAELEQLRAEVAALKAEVQQMHAEHAVAAVHAAAPAAAPASNPVAVSSAVAGPDNTALWGYGQIDYNRPTAHSGDAQADLSRAVVGFDHVFDETTRVYGELEWEHAIVSTDDRG